MENQRCLNRIFYVLIILSFHSFVFTAKYFTVTDNELELDRSYSWDTFISEMQYAEFISTSDDNDYGIPFKTVLRVDTDVSNDFRVFLRNVDSNGDLGDEYQVVVKKGDLDDFRDNFIDRNCLKFSNDFPVKFFKVRSTAEMGDISFYSSPNDASRPITDINYEDIFYYAFATKNYGNSKYVLLGITTYIEGNFELENRLLGWVLYERNKEKQNAILWNTNIGIRPNQDSQSMLLPVVFNSNAQGFAAAQEYANNDVSLREIADDLFVNQDGITYYNNQMNTFRGIQQRWLPFYASGEDDDFDFVKVGVIEEIANMKQRSLKNTIFAEEVQIAFIVDATMSMSQVWKNLDDVLEKIVRNLITEGIPNEKGDIVKPKIKIWYYNNPDPNNPHHTNGLGAYSLTDTWISEPHHLDDIRSVIQDINLRASRFARAPMLEGIMFALEDPDVKEKPTFFVVIGDAAPEDYVNKSVPDFMGFDTKGGLKFMKGIRYKSDIVFQVENQLGSVDREYVDIYQEFKSRNFPGTSFLYDIIPSYDPYSGVNLNEVEKVQVADAISEVISIELSQTFDAISDFMQGNTSSIEIPNSNQLFTKQHTDELEQALKPIETGIYFNEGILIARDLDGEILVNTDIYIEDGDMVNLRRYLSKFVNRPDLPNAKTVIRRILETFFEVDYSDISEDFLRNTTFKDLWTKIVGDQDIANALTPDLFDNVDFNFLDALESLKDSNNQERFRTNISAARSQLENQIDNDLSHLILEVKAGENGKLETVEYYWVPTNIFAIFNGLQID